MSMFAVFVKICNVPNAPCSHEVDELHMFDTESQEARSFGLGGGQAYLALNTFLFYFSTGWGGNIWRTQSVQFIFYVFPRFVLEFLALCPSFQAFSFHIHFKCNSFSVQILLM